MSALPKGWVRIPIDDTGEYINGFAFKPGHRETQGLPIIRIQNLTDESKPLNRTALQVPSEYHVATGDMLMSWSATLDVFIWRREPALVNQHIFKVAPDKRVIDERLFFHCLKLAIDQLLETEHLQPINWRMFFACFPLCHVPTRFPAEGLPAQGSGGWPQEH